MAAEEFEPKKKVLLLDIDDTVLDLTEGITPQIKNPEYLIPLLLYAQAQGIDIYVSTSRTDTLDSERNTAYVTVNELLEELQRYGVHIPPENIYKGTGRVREVEEQIEKEVRKDETYMSVPENQIVKRIKQLGGGKNIYLHLIIEDWLNKHPSATLKSSEVCVMDDAKGIIKALEHFQFDHPRYSNDGPIQGVKATERGDPDTTYLTEKFANILGFNQLGTTEREKIYQRCYRQS